MNEFDASKDILVSQNVMGYDKSTIVQLEAYAKDQNLPLFLLTGPIIEKKYEKEDSLFSVILIPKHKILFVNSGRKDKEEDFEDFIEDVLEDVGSLSDRFDYKNLIGRRRTWGELWEKIDNQNDGGIVEYLRGLKIDNDKILQRRIKYLISLFIGSVNDVKNAELDVPDNQLDLIKNKIQLFDCDQTRFIYTNPHPENKIYKIQGLSGTGKTELLLHKLREVYVNEPEARIGFTCYSKVLANNLKKRIPEFFDFMNVQRQINEERLLCVNAWGNYLDPYSGIYRFICDFYGLPFYSYREVYNFEFACKYIIQEIEKRKTEDPESFSYAFQYIFIDESQDFKDTFFTMCELVTEKKVYIAGDIFQTIFANSDNGNDVKGDLLLSKCYRTSPKTFMISQALGWGLFESPKIRWLSDKAWKTCGYQIEHSNSDNIILKREPLTRFDGDIEAEESFVLEETNNPIEHIIKIIEDIKEKYPSVEPDDLCIIFLDSEQYVYEYVSKLKESLYEEYEWESNIAYETKRQIKGRVFITNHRNVKGLEFPFVICYTAGLKREITHRNLLYTMISRSLLKTYLIMDIDKNGITETIRSGINQILKNGKMTLTVPSEEERQRMTFRKMEFETTKTLKERLEPILKDNNISVDDLEAYIHYINKTNRNIESDEALTEFVLDVYKLGIIH